jgi:PhnB protein
MITFSLYLNFSGNTMEAFQFYKSIFGGSFELLQTMKETPGIPNLSSEDAEKIMHVSLPIGENMILHGTDALESMGQKLILGNNVHIMLNPQSKQDADKYYAALSSGGNNLMPMQDMFWGDYYGSFTDKFGIQWMINYTKK